MTDIRHILEAKSDQLNAVDIMGSEKIITITSVEVTKDLITVHYDGEGKKPWKIGNKTVPRILDRIWDAKGETDVWVGKTVAVHYDPTVVYAGEAVGGIRPHAASHIDSKQIVKTREMRGNKLKGFEILPLRLEAVKGSATPRVVEFSMEGYERVINSIVAMTDPEAMKARFEKAADWRLLAVKEDREKATALREKYEARLEELEAQ